MRTSFTLDFGLDLRVEWVVRQFDRARLILVCTKHEEAPFSNAGFHRGAEFNRGLRQFPTSRFKAEWRNPILFKEDHQTGVNRAPTTVEPSVRCCQFDFLTAVYFG
jgi:hypothetical protein